MGILCPLFRNFPLREETFTFRTSSARTEEPSKVCLQMSGKKWVLAEFGRRGSVGLAPKGWGYPASPRDAPMKLEPYGKLEPQQMAREGWMCYL